MKDKKSCCRRFPLVLIFISTLFALAIWYSYEGAHSFAFLTNKGEIFNFIATILFIAIIPIGLYYSFAESKKRAAKAKLISLLGFLPVIAFLLFVLY